MASTSKDGAPISKDTHHKMSKKIAQLTKVIFHLHSKNEENSQYHQALVNAYEKEIETILRDANTVVNRQKDALDRVKEQNSVKDKIKEIEEKHDKEKKETQKQFEEYKQKVQNKEQQMEKEY